MTGYIGIGGTAKKIKNIYIGVGGVAKQVKKAYIGVGGIAKLWYSSQKSLVYYGTLTDLSVARAEITSASIGNYAIFAGGRTGSAQSTVDAYKGTDLTHTTPTYSLPAENYNSAGASNTSYAIFAGGQNNYGSVVSTVTAYNSSLTRSTPSKQLSQTRLYLAGAASGGGTRAVFAGGSNSSSSGYNSVDVYNTSLTRSTPTTKLSTARWYLAGGSVGAYAVFAGGQTASSTYSDVVDAYNGSNTHYTPTTALYTARTNLAAASVGDYVIFAGGRTGTGVTNLSTRTDAYNTSLVYVTPPSGLSSAREYMGRASIDGYAIFAAGYGYNSSSQRVYSARVDAYTSSLVRVAGDNLPVGLVYPCGASVNNYALFAGGYTGSYVATVYAYTIQ